MRKGFTLIETVISTSLMAIIFSAVIGAWTFLFFKSNKVYKQAMLDMDARKVTERFRYEVRNAARETIMFYPEHQAPYEALGFALAEDSDNDGLIDLDATGSNILWQKTVVYHIWRGREIPQMRQTVFENRNNAASREDFYQQMAQVYKLGAGDKACLSGERSETRVLYENLFTGKLWHAESRFDGYSPVLNSQDKTTFGSLSLGPGEHKIEFSIAGKHPKSSGYALRIDQLSASISGWPLEAENCLVQGTVNNASFVGPNLAGAAYGLYAATAAQGDKFTVTVYNDAIDECEFVGLGKNVSLSNTVVRFDAELATTLRPQGSYANLLDGEFAEMWNVKNQTGSLQRNTYFYPTNCTMRIPVMAPWYSATGYGPVFRLYKSYYNGGAQIINPVFSIVPTPDDIAMMPSPDVSAEVQIPLIFYQNGQRRPNWASCDSYSYVELRPEETIRIGNYSTLILSFRVQIEQYGSDRFTAYSVLRSGVDGSWHVPDSSKTEGVANDWSSPFGLVVTNKCLPLLEQAAVNYAEKGEFISHIYDTRANPGIPKTIEWEADIPSGADMALFTRSGDRISDDGLDILDAPSWLNVPAASNGGTVCGTGRYVQFRTVMQGVSHSLYPGLTGASSQGPYCRDTPRLYRVMMKWDGEEKYVDIHGRLLKSPDCGIFNVSVDGEPLIRGVTMEIEIFKDIPTMGKRTERLKSTMMAEVEPRNSQN